MSGYSLIQQIRDLEQDIFDLGFQWGNPRNGDFNNKYGDVVALFPRDDELPLYARDAELFCGSISDLAIWLRGLKYARDYDKMLNVSTDKKRAEKEQDIREKQMITRLKNEKVHRNLSVEQLDALEHDDA